MSRTVAAAGRQERSVHAIVWRLRMAMSLGLKVRFFWEGSRRVEDHGIRALWIDPQRVRKSGDKREGYSNLVVTFENGAELAINSMRNAVLIPREPNV